MVVTSGIALKTEEIVQLTGYDAIIQLKDYKCRIMNYSPNQKIEVVDIVEYKKKKWGIRKLQNPRKEYQYIAFIVKDD